MQKSLFFSTLCEFTRKSRKLPFVGVILLPYTTRSQCESETARAANLLQTQHQLVRGLGEEAFTIGDSLLLVYARGKAFELSYLFNRSSRRSETRRRNSRWLVCDSHRRSRFLLVKRAWHAQRVA